MIRNILFSTILTFILLFAVGCQQNNDDGVLPLKHIAPEEKIHHFLYSSYKTNSDYDDNLADISIKMIGEKEPIAIDTGVDNDTALYFSDAQAVFYEKENNDLYQYKIGDKEPTKLAKDIKYYYPSLFDQGMIAYTDRDDNFHLLVDGQEPEKIAENIVQYRTIGDELYYLNESGQLKLYHLIEQTETMIAKDVEVFLSLHTNGEMIFNDTDFGLYYIKEKGAEAVKLIDEPYNLSYNIGNHDYFIGFAKLGDYFIYKNLDEEDSDTSGPLMQVNLKKMSEPTEIAADVELFDYDEKSHDFYFLDKAGDFHTMNIKDKTPTKIDDDVEVFLLNENNDYFYVKENGDMGEFYLKGEQDVFLKRDLEDYVDFGITASADIYYVTENDELFVNDKKITNDLHDYAYLYGNLAYSTNSRELYLMENMEEAKLIDDDLSDVSEVKYFYETIFYNELTIDDFIGVWKVDDHHYIEIEEDGVIYDTKLDGRETYKEEYGSVMSVDLVDEYDNSLSITKTSEDEIKFEYGDGFTNYAQKSTQEAIDDFLADQEIADIEYELDRLIGYYTHHFADALNENNGINLRNYIDTSSDFYKEEVTYVESIAQYDIYKEIIGYDIIDIKKDKHDDYQVTVDERYSVYNEDDGTMKDEDITHIYTITAKDGSFYIADKKVK